MPVAVEVSNQQPDLPQRRGGFLGVVDCIVNRVLADGDGGAHFHIDFLNCVPVDQYAAEQKTRYQDKADPQNEGSAQRHRFAGMTEAVACARPGVNSDPLADGCGVQTQ